MLQTFIKKVTLYIIQHRKMKLNKVLKKVANAINVFVLAEQDEKINLNRLINKWTCGSKVYDYVHIDRYN